jgi:hypothetical protein
LVWFGGQQRWFDVVRYSGSDERDKTGYYAWFGLGLSCLALYGGQQVWFGLVGSKVDLVW